MASEENEQLEKRTALGASLQAESRGSPGSPVSWEFPMEEEAQREGIKSKSGLNLKAQTSHLENWAVCSGSGVGIDLKLLLASHDAAEYNS